MSGHNKGDYTHVTHTFAPVFTEDSGVLILGSFPSVKSREQQFYYGHAQNRFWKVMAAVYKNDIPVTISEKEEFLKRNQVALWDVIASCDIVGSSDSSIRNVIGNDMDVILKRASIRGIFANGDKAYQLYLRYCSREGQPPLYRLPSTSPANAAWSLERLIDAWTDALRPDRAKECQGKDRRRVCACGQGEGVPRQRIDSVCRFAGGQKTAAGK